MFAITDGKGFKVTFGNGVTVSVQFGPGNYCGNYNLSYKDRPLTDGEFKCKDAEIAIWDKKGEWITSKCWARVFHMAHQDMVVGRIDADILPKVFKWASKYNG
jgi:hypothetical protein